MIMLCLIPRPKTEFRVCMGIRPDHSKHVMLTLAFLYIVYDINFVAKLQYLTLPVRRTYVSYWKYFNMKTK